MFTTLQLNGRQPSVLFPGLRAAEVVARRLLPDLPPEFLDPHSVRIEPIVDGVASLYVEYPPPSGGHPGGVLPAVRLYLFLRTVIGTGEPPNPNPPLEVHGVAWRHHCGSYAEVDVTQANPFPDTQGVLFFPTAEIAGEAHLVQVSRRSFEVRSLTHAAVSWLDGPSSKAVLERRPFDSLRTFIDVCAELERLRLRRDLSARHTGERGELPPVLTG